MDEINVNFLLRKFLSTPDGWRKVAASAYKPTELQVKSLLPVGLNSNFTLTTEHKALIDLAVKGLVESKINTPSINNLNKLVDKIASDICEQILSSEGSGF